MTADREEPGVGEPGADPTTGGASPPGDDGLPGRRGVVTASSMDSITLPERSRHEGAGRPVRRRRSAAHSPVVVAPIDVPEDAEGRVEIFAVRAPQEVVEPAPPSGNGGGGPGLPGSSAAAGAAGDAEETAPEGSAEVLAFGPPPVLARRPRWGEDLLTLRSGWAAVLVLAILLAVLFVVGDLLTH